MAIVMKTATDSNSNSGEIKLNQALLQAFSLESLKRMVHLHLGLVLEDEIDLHRGKKYIVADLVDLSVRQGWRDELIRAALDDNSGNLSLREVAKTITDVASRRPASLLKAGDPGALEKLVRERGVFLKWQDFTQRLASLGRHLCRIEIPTGTAVGTGWLVYSDLVLTNHHVVEDLVQQRCAVADVTCRFDYFVDSIADDVGGVACGLADVWRVDLSPCAEADTRADAPDPTTEQLDYALVRLARPVGDDPLTPGGGKRGWVHVNAAPPVVVHDDVLLVPQHPDGRSLEVAFGKALEYNSTATRLRHDVNTEKGSSGAPCLIVTLDPFGLHHASGPGRKLRYNQCVPLRHIIQAMVRHKVSPFWEV
jgi:Trypsin-like peptidase domain/Effector-associated domain 1